MPVKTVHVGAEIDADTNRGLEKLAEKMGRSKKRQAAIWIRQIVDLSESHEGDLQRLGLLQMTPATK